MNATFKRLMAINDLKIANIDLNEWKSLESELTDPECVETETIPNFYKTLAEYTEKQQKAIVGYHKAHLEYLIEIDA